MCDDIKHNNCGLHFWLLATTYIIFEYIKSVRYVLANNQQIVRLWLGEGAEKR